MKRVNCVDCGRPRGHINHWGKSAHPFITKPPKCKGCKRRTGTRISRPTISKIVHKKPVGEYYLTICGQKVAHSLRENPLFHRTLKGGELVFTDHHYPKGSIPCETCYPVKQPKSRIPLFSAVVVVLGASVVFGIKQLRKNKHGRQSK